MPTNWVLWETKRGKVSQSSCYNSCYNCLNRIIIGLFLNTVHVYFPWFWFISLQPFCWIDRLYILFSQYRSCDDPQEAFVLFIKKSTRKHEYVCMYSFYWTRQRIKSLELITWSVLGKQNVRAKKVYNPYGIRKNGCLTCIVRKSKWSPIILCSLVGQNQRSWSCAKIK